jgi:hypothetical protein
LKKLIKHRECDAAHRLQAIVREMKKFPENLTIAAHFDAENPVRISDRGHKKAGVRGEIVQFLPFF